MRAVPSVEFVREGRKWNWRLKDAGGVFARGRKSHRRRADAIRDMEKVGRVAVRWRLYWLGDE